MTTFPHYTSTLDYLPLQNSFVPSEMPSDKLFVFLHGRGGKGEDFVWMADALGFDEMHYLFLNAPTPYGEGYSWYGAKPDDIQHSFGLLTQTLDRVFADGFDIKQSILGGFSQGAALTFEFGSRYSSTFGGYIALSGQLFEPQKLIAEQLHPLQTSKWLCIHGTDDEALPCTTTQEQIHLLQKQGYMIDFATFGITHTITPEVIAHIKAWIQSNVV